MKSFHARENVACSAPDLYHSFNTAVNNSNPRIDGGLLGRMRAAIYVVVQIPHFSFLYGEFVCVPWSMFIDWSEVRIFTVAGKFVKAPSKSPFNEFTPWRVFLIAAAFYTIKLLR